MCDLAQQSNADTQVHPRQEQKPVNTLWGFSMNVQIPGITPGNRLPRWMKRELPSWHNPDYFLLFSQK